MEMDARAPKFRLVAGTTREVEDWINANWDSYVIQNFAWSVIDGRQHVTATAILKTEVEKAARMMQFAQAGAMPGGRRM